MGVSLERVQNKFACIIGELCNEPLVLSQFAVWLDMRLAEYKAKGSLCLECSGDIPTPIWLKGLPLKEPIVEAEDRWELPRDTGQSFRGDELGRRGDNLHEPNKYNRRHRSFLPHGDSGTATPISHPSSPIRTDLHLHSNIAIKQEVLDQDIAPLGLHSSDNYHTDSRKRTAEFENLYSSPSKVQRFSSEKDNAEVSPYTEPLSSIIDPQDTPISKSEGLVPVENMSTSSQQAYENVIDDDDDIQVEILGGPSSLIHSPATSINQTYPGPSTSETGHSLAANSADSESSRLSFGDSMSADPANLTGNVKNPTPVLLSVAGGSRSSVSGAGPIPKLTCDECGKVLSSCAAFRRHMRAHESPDTHFCPHCNKALSRLDSLRRHLKTCHPHRGQLR